MIPVVDSWFVLFVVYCWYIVLVMVFLCRFGELCLFVSRLLTVFAFCTLHLATLDWLNYCVVLVTCMRGLLNRCVVAATIGTWFVDGGGFASFSLLCLFA